MPMIVHADITTLLDAISAGDTDAMIAATLQLLGPEHVPPRKVAARVGVPAAWGGGEGHPLATLSVVGEVAEWMRAIPIGPEPGAEERRNLAAALPLVQGFVAVGSLVKKGLAEPHPALPEPLYPADVHAEGGSEAGFAAAVNTRDLNRAQRLLMGYYATGTDYRAVLATIFAALATRYPAHGHPTIFASAGSRVLDMAEWGDRMPAYIWWLTPLLMDNAPQSPAGEAAAAYVANSAHDLAWVRTRLAIPKEEAAGTAFQRAVVQGDYAAACDAVLKALRDGATPMGVASGLALAAAAEVNNVPQGDTEGLMRTGHALLYVNAVHYATVQTQEHQIWPLLYTAACAVNAARNVTPSGNLAAVRPAPASMPIGGLIAASMLRGIEQQLAAGDTAGALTGATRYLQMGHPQRALAGVIGAVASTRDASPAQPESLHILPIVAAAADEYLALPHALQNNGQNALLNAAIRLAAELTAPQTVADRVRAAIAQRLAQ
ncbi:MAG TPA: hypothetical protein VJQ45_06560 [Ktedonobacterales bacterium]|nr:hypothetical protein [Ktedonobacterales bacterium]